MRSKVMNWSIKNDMIAEFMEVNSMTVIHNTSVLGHFHMGSILDMQHSVRRFASSVSNSYVEGRHHRLDGRHRWSQGRRHWLKGRHYWREERRHWLDGAVFFCFFFYNGSPNEVPDDYHVLDR